MIFGAGLTIPRGLVPLLRAAIS
ncbi:MAG: hypothetical protein V7635_145, partial [Arthrobacter sp.]